MKHGFATSGGKTPTYRSWGMMISRCRNRNFHKFINYGGRGISVCHRWLDFRKFLSDMGVRPEGLTLHRINNDGDYEPSNCIWATPKEQGQNTTRTVLSKEKAIEIRQLAKEMGPTEIARRFNLPISTVGTVLYKQSAWT